MESSGGSKHHPHSGALAMSTVLMTNDNRKVGRQTRRGFSLASIGVFMGLLLYPRNPMNSGKLLPPEVIVLMYTNIGIPLGHFTTPCKLQGMCHSRLYLQYFINIYVLLFGRR
jgi:hypothetical protein